MKKLLALAVGLGVACNYAYADYTQAAGPAKKYKFYWEDNVPSTPLVRIRSIRPDYINYRDITSMYPVDNNGVPTGSRINALPGRPIAKVRYALPNGRWFGGASPSSVYFGIEGSATSGAHRGYLKMQFDAQDVFAAKTGYLSAKINFVEDVSRIRFDVTDIDYRGASISCPALATGIANLKNDNGCAHQDVVNVLDGSNAITGIFTDGNGNVASRRDNRCTSYQGATEQYDAGWTAKGNSVCSERRILLVDYDYPWAQNDENKGNIEFKIADNGKDEGVFVNFKPGFSGRIPASNQYIGITDVRFSFNDSDGDGVDDYFDTAINDVCTTSNTANNNGCPVPNIAPRDDRTYNAADEAIPFTITFDEEESVDDFTESDLSAVYSDGTPATIKPDSFIKVNGLGGKATWFVSVLLPDDSVAAQYKANSIKVSLDRGKVTQQKTTGGRTYPIPNLAGESVAVQYNINPTVGGIITDTRDANNDSDVSLSVSAADPNANYQFQVASIGEDGTVGDWEDIGPNSTATTYVDQDRADGNYQYRVVTTPSDGRDPATSDPIDVLVDTTPPDAPIVGVTTNETDTTVQVEGQPGETAKVTADGETKECIIGANHVCEVDFPVLDPNTPITVTVTDESGNESDPVTVTAPENACVPLPGSNDIDGDGVPNESDFDIDGDGIPNAVKGSDDVTIPRDPDIDGDCIPNGDDNNKDGDDKRDSDDPTPYGPVEDYLLKDSFES